MEFTYLVAIVLGIVEGLTEYLPVSSTGHLILAGHLLGVDGAKAHTFEIFIQSGAILAIVVLYWARFKSLVSFKSPTSESNSFSGTQGLLKLLVAALPAFCIGFILHDFIKENLFSPHTVAYGLILGAIVILVTEAKPKLVSRSSVDELTYTDCLKIGLFQCFALWPGVSRSAATIIGGLLLGFERRLAAEFSFILAVPVLIVACAYDLFKNINLLSKSDVPYLAVGFIVSFVVALVTVKALLSFVQKNKFTIFAYYRILIGLLVFYLI